MSGNNDHEDKKEPEKSGMGDGQMALVVVAGIFGFGFLLAFFAKNFNQHLMTFLGVGVVAGFGYLLIKHTEMTIKIVTFLIVISLVGGVFNYCSKQERFREYEGTGPGFR